METMNDKISQFSGFTETKLTLTSPVQFDTKLEYKRLTLMTGMNNTGKSFLNKLMWASATFFNMKLIEKVIGIKDSEKSDEEIFQYILDNTFDGNNINGAVEFNARDEILKVAYYNIRFEMKDGKIDWLKFSWPEDAQPMGAITYLSKDARDFTNIERYLKTKKLLGITEIDNWESIEKICEMYKLYDVFAIEQLLIKFESANKYLTALQALAGINGGSAGADELMSGMDIKSINYDKENMKVEYQNSKGQTMPISSMGLGSQSILTMLMSSIN